MFILPLALLRYHTFDVQNVHYLPAQMVTEPAEIVIFVFLKVVWHHVFRCDGIFSDQVLLVYQRKNFEDVQFNVQFMINLAV